ncbi:MAG: Unknown protein [uncultured Sulfurovum sp.]|uniref:FUN14 family protein n=1 Tax=uncultured Sulfurovum sp. TaxID=269237 RepID=A0A6S6TPB3_9BACT|nr:MAG: Unknown protein [uncultured Sulfurovum sp.]
MTKEAYIDQVNQANNYGHTGNQKMGHMNNFNEPSVYSDPVPVDSPLAYLEMGSGFIIGLAVGFFIKKSFKIVLFILGFALIATFYMESQGIFTINDQVLEESIANGVKYFDYLVSAVKERITSFQSGAGALAGFLVGLKLG